MAAPRRSPGPEFRDSGGEPDLNGVQVSGQSRVCYWRVVNITPYVPVGGGNGNTGGYGSAAPPSAVPPSTSTATIETSLLQCDGLPLEYRAFPSQNAPTTLGRAPVDGDKIRISLVDEGYIGSTWQYGPSGWLRLSGDCGRPRSGGVNL